MALALPAVIVLQLHRLLSSEMIGQWLKPQNSQGATALRWALNNFMHSEVAF